MLKISIPEPCHEDWNKMEPNEQGRHCNSCAKTVVDFTNLSDEEVKNFFLNKKERVCGRFKQDQLHRVVIDLPHNIFSIAMPVWKRFLVASLIVFSTTLFSCDTSIDGKLIKGNGIAALAENSVNNIRERSEFTVGEMIAQPDTSRVTVTPNTVFGYASPKIIRVPDPKISIGDLAIMPTDTTTAKKCGSKQILDGSSERPLMGVPIFEMVKETKTDSPAKSKKDPPKADSTDCNKKTYY